MIKGIEGLDDQQILEEVKKGGKFVSFEFCTSLIIVSWVRKSDIYFIRRGESLFFKGIGFSLLSLLLGLWSYWGFFFTIGTIITNFKGGNNDTLEVLASFNLSLRSPKKKKKKVDEIE